MGTLEGDGDPRFFHEAVMHNHSHHDRLFVFNPVGRSPDIGVGLGCRSSAPPADLHRNRRELGMYESNITSDLIPSIRSRVTEVSISLVAA